MAAPDSYNTKAREMANQTPEEKAAADAAAAKKATDEKVAADAKAATEASEKAAAEELKSLVKMTHKTHGELHVHPTCVAAHQAIGFKVA